MKWLTTNTLINWLKKPSSLTKDGKYNIDNFLSKNWRLTFDFSIESVNFEKEYIRTRNKESSYLKTHTFFELVRIFNSALMEFKNAVEETVKQQKFYKQKDNFQYELCYISHSKKYVIFKVNMKNAEIKQIFEGSWENAFEKWNTIMEDAISEVSRINYEKIFA